MRKPVDRKGPSLFRPLAPQPLADRLRPRRLEEVVGQDHLLGADGTIGRMVASGRLGSMILWGPPGCGKTTIARLLAHRTDLEFVPLSAVFSGVADLRRVFEQARASRDAGRGTLLFIDEIHRFNRAQQDGFLPYVEDGTVILVGATTENPSFELNPPLLSRCRVLVLNRLDDTALEEILLRAERAIGRPLPLDADARAGLRAIADGDGRYLLNLVEVLADVPAEPVLDTAALTQLVQRRMPLYDKGQESHYNLISALHKSLRGSDTDAALYWFARMIAGGEDPNYIARRLVRFAVEDVGLADPQALVQALAAWQAYERLGSPEGELALVQCVIYLGSAPKSNAAYRAASAASTAARETGSLMPPKHILNAPTRLMKDLGYGRGYEYDHEAPDAFSGQNYFPDGLERRRLYHPGDRGFEREIAARLAHWEKLRAAKAADR
ncbi:MAG: replication-associated recombination protein A [Bacteroidota bacterium]